MFGVQSTQSRLTAAKPTYRYQCESVSALAIWHKPRTACLARRLGDQSRLRQKDGLRQMRQVTGPAPGTGGWHHAWPVAVEDVTYAWRG